jgi:ABC-type transport system substrate-binding protein
MRRIVVIFMAGLLLASCAPQPAPVPTTFPSPTATPIHAPEIRFALIGEPQDVNAWQLFDESGARYADYALRFEYWPHLYQLTLPAFDFQPAAAEGMPSAVIQEGGEYSATIKLRADLKWTDGVAFTAEDVAFTVNTSLKYELGYDWDSFYARDYLARVEAIDPVTVKFYFKQMPNVQSWQYGAVQGPILQRAFWEPRISQASTLLPGEQLAADIAYSTDYLASVQARVDDLTAQVNALFSKGQENKELSGELVKRQEELNYAKNTLNKLLEERTAAMESARQDLYHVDDDGEPTLGTWIPAGRNGNAWTNEANPDFPFAQPYFDRAVYKTYPDAESAYSAFSKGEVDVVLDPDGTTQHALSVPAPNSSNRFLIFNPNNALLSDGNLRKALACVIAPQDIGLSQGEFVSNTAWKNTDAPVPCAGLVAEQRVKNAVEYLKKGGYSWSQEPGVSQPGVGLKKPDGSDFPRITLISTTLEVDADRANMATYIEQRALRLGIPLDVQLTDLASLQYAVYSSEKYDMAIFGWRLSEYPGYLCGWFGVGGQFENTGSKLGSACEALAVESDLQAAKDQIFEIQSVLSEELSFVPLYANLRYDAYQHVQYPFDSVVGGVSGLYGAPSYAMPAP